MDDSDSTDEELGSSEGLELGSGDGPVSEAGSDEHEFDITLAASHSYMGPGLERVSGRAALEAGWSALVPLLAAGGARFPGETVPLLLHALPAPLVTALLRDRLFALQGPARLGALCELYEAGEDGGALSLKARVIHRVRLTDATPPPGWARARVLPDLAPADPLRPARLRSLDPLRGACPRQDTLLRALDAALTPWPPSVYALADYPRLRARIVEYFAALGIDRVPEEPVSLSFWAASNLALAARDREALLAEDSALLRLHMEVQLIDKKCALCCSTCSTEIAHREDILPMSSEGVHANYTNPGGYMHDIVTVSMARHTRLSGGPSAQFSWFPGYAWTIALCATCGTHVGWRFTSLRRSLRPRQFYGLSRAAVQPPSTPSDGTY